MHNPPRWARIAASILAVALAAGVTIVFVDLDGDERTDRVVITLPNAAPDGGTATVVADPDKAVQPDEAAQSATDDPVQEGPAIHEDNVDETPPGAPTDAPTQVIESETQGIGQPEILGGAQRLGCKTNLVRNRSSRNGAAVKLFVLHYTVSRPGSLDAIRGLFDRTSFAASSTYGLEVNGRCEQWVPTGEKPWTQGAFNPVSESVEIIALGTEPREFWLNSAIIKKGLLADLVRDRLRANGLPLRRVNPVGCAVQRAGWTDHNALECGNNHHDVLPSFPYDVLTRQIKEGSCSTRCARTRSLRKRHAATHKELRDRRCAPRTKTRSDRCRLLHTRNRAIHNAAKRERVRL